MKREFLGEFTLTRITEKDIEFQLYVYTIKMLYEFNDEGMIIKTFNTF